MMQIPATLKLDQLVAIVDTREQWPLNLSPMATKQASLSTADYSVAGLEDVVAVERKSLADLVACCGRERDRFEREVDRLLAIPARLLVVESCWEAIISGLWEGRVSPDCVLNSLFSWSASGLPFILAGDRGRAAEVARRFLYLAARREYRRGRQMFMSLRGS